MFKTFLVVVPLALIVFSVFGTIQRKLMFYPTHDRKDNGLDRWIVNGEVVGYCQKAVSPKNVWVMFHGNGGQAADRTYALPCFSPDDSIYIMEYPGYGQRKGRPTEKTINLSAVEAYQYIRSRYPDTPVCVAGESIGSGPASLMAMQRPPPDKIVLVVPFDRLSLVAREHFPVWLVRLMMRDDWDNVKSLSHYNGPVDIFGAREDSIIPVKHAERLANAYKNATFTLVDGGHNEWSCNPRVVIQNPATENPQPNTSLLKQEM